MNCDIVTSSNCYAPANLEEDAHLRTHCYGCGLSVCKACSSHTSWFGATRRICDNCLSDQPDGEARVLRRRYQEAGYNVTLQDCKDLLSMEYAYWNFQPYPANSALSRQELAKRISAYQSRMQA